MTYNMGNTGKSGNGELKDISPDEDHETPKNAIGHRENRHMLSILANYLTEAKTHSARLETLYIALKEMEVKVSPVWTGTLLSEFERHHEAEGNNLTSLRQYLQSPISAGAPPDTDDEG